MQGFIGNFMDGYNVTVCASGQTGAGKTHSLIAPSGSIQKPGGHDLSGAVLDHYGIFPRAVLQLFNQISGKGDVMTLSICQMGGWRYLPMDCVTDKSVFFDDKLLKYVGLQECVLHEASDVIKYMIMLEKKRFAEPTKSNSNSSRTNALIEFKWYRKTDDKFSVQSFRFLDMAGSERTSKDELNSGRSFKNGMLSLGTGTNNIGLSNF